MRPSRLSVRDLTVDVGGNTVLDSVDLTVGQGEILAVLGRSGAGKSTILRAIAGLVEVRSGAIEIDGTDVTLIPPHRRDVGFMFQDDALFPHLDVAGNVGFGLRMRGADRAVIRHRVNDLLELVGLPGFGGRAVGELSGGEAQRVALARALAPEPRVLLLDEPLASLDLPRRRDLLSELRRLLSELDQSAVYVTHDRDEAMAIADSLGVIDSGRIARAGDAMEVWRDPQLAVAAQVLGHVNVVESAVLVVAGLLTPGGAADGLLLVPRGAVRQADGGVRSVVVGRGLVGDTATCTVTVGGIELATGFDAPVGATVQIAVDRSLLQSLSR